MRFSILAIGTLCGAGMVFLFPAQAAEMHWFGPGYYEYQCSNGEKDCKLDSGPHETLSVCMKKAADHQEYIETFFPGEDIAPPKCAYFGEKPADTEHFDHG